MNVLTKTVINLLEKVITLLFGGEAPTLDADPELASIPGDTEDDETDAPVEKKQFISQNFFQITISRNFLPYLMTCDDY